MSSYYDDYVNNWSVERVRKRLPARFLLSSVGWDAIKAKSVLDGSRQRYKQFGALSSIQREKYQQFKVPVRRAIILETFVLTRMGHILYAGVASLFISALLIIVATLLLFDLPTETLGYVILSSILCFISVIVLEFFVLYFSGFLEGLLDHPRYPAFVLCFLLLNYAVVFFWLNLPTIYLSYIGVIALITLFLEHILVCIEILGFVNIVRPLIRRRIYFQNSALPSVANLVEILCTLEYGERYWDTDLMKQFLIEGLERSARNIKIYSTHETGDFQTNLWLEEKSSYVANCIRSYKKWVLTPQVDTRVKLLQSLEWVLECILMSYWDGIPSYELNTLDRSTIHSTGQRIVRTLASALSPLIILFVLQKVDAPALMTGPLPTLVNWIAVGWLVFSLLHLIDPEIAERLDMMKNLRDILRP